MPDLKRLEVDEGEIAEMNNVRFEIPDLNDITKFYVFVRVHDGLYRKKWFKFQFTIPEDWPYAPPDVRIIDKIWHPNIELAKDKVPGRVCVSTLKNNYRGTMLLTEIVESLKYVLQNPNPNDALNVEAAEEQKKNYDSFKRRAIDYLDDMASDDEEEDEDH